MFALATAAASPAVAQDVHFMPQRSSASYCNTTSVEIWVDATNFQSGQIELTYNPFYANVTDWVRNTTNFPMGGWTPEDGNDRINFMGSAPKTGEYLIGTLTIHCVNESREGCVTTLDFNEEQSKLFDDHGSTVPANWIDSSFECKSLLDVQQTPTAAAGGGNTHTRISGGNSQSEDEAEAEAGDVETPPGPDTHPESGATHEEEPTPAAQTPQEHESMSLIMIIAIALAAATVILILGIIGIGIRRRRHRK